MNIEEHITAKLVSQGIVGKENAQVLQRVKDENFVVSVLLGDEVEESPGAVEIIWRLVEDILKGEGK